MAIEAEEINNATINNDLVTLNLSDNNSTPLPHLLEGEILIKVTDYPEAILERKASSIKAIEVLALAENHDQIGENGPILASAALPNRKHEADFTRYQAIFGRDSLRVALDLVGRYPKLTRNTLVRLAELQGVEYEKSREEEPGRILHEYRDLSTDIIAQQLTKELGWGWPYYGSVDATPEFIRTILTYCKTSSEGFAFLEVAYTGKDAKVHTLGESLEAAIDWIMMRLNLNENGLLEYKRAISKGIENQVWKDSWDSYFHTDGTIANHNDGIASIEVQRVAMDALSETATYYNSVFKSEKADLLQKAADKLKDNILHVFWTDNSGGYFVLGTDRGVDKQLRQLAIKTSNMGHLLHSPLLMSEETHIIRKREAVVRHLFSNKLLSFNGIRTLATDEARFRPGAYHNGSVWIWDNYLIAQGLDQQGYHGLARFLESILLNDISSTNRFPEYLRGDADHVHRLNTRLVEVQDNLNHRINFVEQPPQDIQAWSAAAILAIKLKQNKDLPRQAIDSAKRAFELQILNNIEFYPQFLEH